MPRDGHSRVDNMSVDTNRYEVRAPLRLVASKQRLCGLVEDGQAKDPGLPGKIWLVQDLLPVIEGGRSGG